MFGCVFTIGLPIFFFPDMFEFNPPPRSKIVRSSTQRRKLPHGYPFMPRDNPKLKKLYAEFVASKRRDVEDSEGARQAKSKNLARSHSMMSFTANSHFEASTRFDAVDLEAEVPDLDRLVKVAAEISAEVKTSTQRPQIKKSMRWMHKLEVEPKVRSI